MSYDREAYKQKQKETRGRIKEILDDFIPKLVVSPDEIDQYLSGFEGFYQYSLLNQCIAAYEYFATTGRQAEMFATFKRWKEHGRFVKKGERAVHMIRPVRYTVEIENEDGEIEEEEKLTFKPFCVFDIQSTDGKPLIEDDLIKGKSVMSYDEIKSIVEKEFKVYSSPLEIEKGATNGEWIRVSEKSNENYKISTIIHEVAHNKLGHFERDVEKPKEELEAECCAYIVTTLLGLDNQKSRLYIANWNPDDAQEAVRERARLILKTAEEIYKTITANNHQLKLV